MQNFHWNYVSRFLVWENEKENRHWLKFLSMVQIQRTIVLMWQHPRILFINSPSPKGIAIYLTKLFPDPRDPWVLIHGMKWGSLSWKLFFSIFQWSCNGDSHNSSLWSFTCSHHVTVPVTGEPIKTGPELAIGYYK